MTPEKFSVGAESLRTRFVTQLPVARLRTGSLRIGVEARIRFGGDEVVAVRDVDVVGEGPLARIIDQFAIGIVDDEGADVGNAARLVAQFQMNIIAADAGFRTFSC